ncbi:hypothetical protein [Succinatimonas hippei]|uniref:aldose epimerase family protein n=1 Tax=Succinatimonas hippei TaxID=626938 RepID=UPI0024920C8B|nr:hypothetical protein [Succinatimonas hippei]
MAFSEQLIQSLSKAFDTPWPGPRGNLSTIGSDVLSVTVCPEDGARVVSLKHKGVELLRQYNPNRRAFQYGCFPMVPFVGRLRNGDICYAGEKHHLYQNKGQNAMHGMAHFDPWHLNECSSTKLRMTLNVGEPWPWQCKVIQEVNVIGNVLELSLQILTDKDIFPVDAGWHPWFLKEPDNDGTSVLKIDFKADSMEETGSDELPTGNRVSPKEGPWDDCFNFEKYNASAILSYRNKRTITMTSNCPALVVFDKQPDASCINPMSGVPNGLNTNPHVISPNLSLTAKSKWVFE